MSSPDDSYLSSSKDLLKSGFLADKRDNVQESRFQRCELSPTAESHSKNSVVSVVGQWLLQNEAERNLCCHRSFPSPRVLSLKSASGEFANRILGAEKPEHVPHQREQIADLVIRAPFQTFPQLRRDPKHLESFEKIVRSGHLPVVVEQFLN